MTCLQPKSIYVRHSHPIDFNNWEEHEQHHYNRAKLKWEKGYIEMKVPCGECLGCKLDHANEWATRCMLEAKNWRLNCMVTLTYAPKHLPKTITGKTTLFKEDVQKFLKRLRKKHEGAESWINPKTEKIQKPIRYFYCGEYGEKNTKRSHYHMIIFNYQPQDLEFYRFNKHGDIIWKSKSLKKLWGKGFVTVEEMNYNTACYVARYCTKKCGLAKKIRVPSNQFKKDEKGTHTIYRKNKGEPLPQYINMSTGVGIGLKYWLDNMEFLKKWRYIEIKIGDDVKRKPLPRYFKKDWQKKDWESYEQAKYEDWQHSEAKKKEIIKLDNYGDLYTDDEKWQMHLQKIGEILLKRVNNAGLLKRDGVDEDEADKTQPSSAVPCSEKVPKRNQSRQYTDSDRRWERILTRWRAEDIQNEINNIFL